MGLLWIGAGDESWVRIFVSDHLCRRRYCLLLEIMKRFETFLTRFLEGIVAFCLLAIFVLVAALVVLRYVFNSSIPGANEVITILFVYSTSLGAAVVVGKNEHIAVRFAVEGFSGKARKGFDGLQLILVALINGVVFWQSVPWIQTTGKFLMPSTGLPRIVAQFSIPLGCALAMAYCLIRFVSLCLPERLPVQADLLEK